MRSLKRLPPSSFQHITDALEKNWPEGLDDLGHIVVNDQLHVSLCTTDQSIVDIARRQNPSSALAIVDLKDATSTKLPDQLASADSASEVLVIHGDCPTQEQWEAIALHFHNIKTLYLDSGFDESWRDAGFPEAWELQDLVLASSGAEVVRTPVIREGRVRRLSLVLTTGLRFDGPSTSEMVSQLLEDGEAGKEELDYVVHDAGKVRIPIISTYRLASAWLVENYLMAAAKQDLSETPAEPAPDQPRSRIEVLEIIENDAIDTFHSVALGIPALAMGLQKLNIRALQGKHFFPLPQALFPVLLAELANLTHLELSLSEDVFTDKDVVPELYKSFPRSLQVLHFRGPCSLAFDPRFPEWIAAFEDGSCCPELRTLSFVLDGYEQSGDEPPAEMVDAAKAACAKLWEVAESRGIEVVAATDSWAESMSYLRPVDVRWT